MELAPDFDECIGLLTAHGVDIRPTVDNARRLVEALAAFGFPISKLKPEAIATIGIPEPRAPSPDEFQAYMPRIRVTVATRLIATT